jgi:hypothetical protein
MGDGQSLKRLHIDDAYVPGGQKRRVASPNDDHLAMPSDISTMSMPMHPASITTANSFGRRSPVGPSPGGISPTSYNSPYTAPVFLNPSPQTSISGRGSIHSRTVTGASTRKITELQKPGGTKVQGFFMCECCPKKPKRFESLEELK